uniref:SAM domain-containing protein n=1 Tax=Angiostrongylus cantonensis TaxID=6313 RepID=A0A158PC68_ANGCA
MSSSFSLSAIARLLNSIRLLPYNNTHTTQSLLTFRQNRLLQSCFFHLICLTTSLSTADYRNLDFIGVSLLSNPFSTPKTLTPPTSISEWQLLAVLQRANLVQYYDMFISQGGDDINQIMQCDEGEFLEIMSLVGMLSKPLHVRRLQRALTEFSKDQTTFNLAAIQHIGPPPVSPYALGGPDMSFLMPGCLKMNLKTIASATSVLEALPSHQQHLEEPQTWFAANFYRPSGKDRLTLPFCEKSESKCSRRSEMLIFNTITVFLFRSSSPLSIGGDFVSLGDYDPNTALCDSPVLSDAQIRRLSTCAMAICQKIPRLPPKLIQNKKRVSKEVLDLLSASADTPNRLADYRKYSAIYGRFDAKRKPDKGLSFHEVSVNEAAAQLCLIMPSLLTRRDELFPLARQPLSHPLCGYQHFLCWIRFASTYRPESSSNNSLIISAAA